MHIEPNDAQRHLADDTATTSVRDRLLNHFADMLFETDAVLTLLRSQTPESLKFLESRVRTVYSEINEWMTRIAN